MELTKKPLPGAPGKGDRKTQMLRKEERTKQKPQPQAEKPATPRRRQEGGEKQSYERENKEQRRKTGGTRHKAPPSGENSRTRPAAQRP